MAAVSRSNSPSRRRSSWLARSVVGLGIALVVGLVGWLAVRIFGEVAGVEFSPDTFARRQFLYYELPLVRTRLTKVYYEPDMTLARHLASQKLLPPSDAEDERWHLIEMLRSGQTYVDDAVIIIPYLDTELDSGKYWKSWTTDYSKLAPILWSAVAEVARHDLYTFVPELFDVAEQLTVAETGTPGEDKFQSAIDGALARQYTALADLRRHQKRHKSAVMWYEAALKHDEDFAEALRGRELSDAANDDAEAE